MGVQASHGNTTISSHVNVCLFSQSLGLRLRETGVAEMQTSSVNVFRIRSYNPAPEHANLIHDVIPVTRSLQLLRQKPEQLLSHIDNSVRHRADILLPISKQLLVVQDKRNL